MRLLWGLVLLLPGLDAVAAAYPEWRESGSLWILTTPEGADLPATCSEADFPLLVRLRGENFDFAQARPDGADLRFSDSRGQPLPYQIEAWDPAAKTASVWVKIPVVRGNARLEIRMHWGQPAARCESAGGAVFNAASGYCTVLHMDDSLADSAGGIAATDVGSTAVEGLIGPARHVAAGRGINGGDHVTTFPSGGAAFTSEVWFRPEAAGAAVFGWGRYATRLNGNTGDGNEVVINFQSPPSLSWTSDGPGGAAAATTPVLNRWCHVAATYAEGTSRIYVDGKLDGSSVRPRATMSLMNDVGVTIGGFRGQFQFTGRIDEVRVSNVARSADWIKLEYENQKPDQTLVGSLVQKGDAFGVSPEEIAVAEGEDLTVTAQVGGAQKVAWIVRRDDGESVVAVDQASYTFTSGRVSGDTRLVLRLRAVYPDSVKTRDIPVLVREAIPEPVFTLRAPAAWNGRDTIAVVPELANQEAMQAKGVAATSCRWTVSGGAVLKQVMPDRLILTRAQASGPITVRAAIRNGGDESIAAATIQVTEPSSDPWVRRPPDKDEQPEDGQFYARDDRNKAALHYNGVLAGAADEVFLKVFADGRLFAHETRPLAAGNRYAFSIPLEPGLIRYDVEFGTVTGGTETVVRKVGDIVCGDAYIIVGQSNAEATGPNNGPAEDPTAPVNDWIRSYGNQHDGTPRGGWGRAVRTRIWGRPEYGAHQIGAWGMVLARQLVEKHRIPICIINGAYGGTPIWQHQPNPADHHDSSGDFYRNPYKIYGCLLTRVAAAKLTHGIRGILWHQGENDSGAGAPTGDWNYRSYQQDFIDLAAAWKTDYPNVRSYYVFQVWPAPCNMGPKDDQLREAQRTLPRLFSNLRVMSTVGIAGPTTGRGSCHFEVADYARFAEFMSPLVEVDHYGLVPAEAVTAPNLEAAWFTSPARDEIALDFGQPMTWKEGMGKDIYLDGVAPAITAGSAAGNVITLTLSEPATATTIGYLSGRHWDGNPASLIFGANGIAALTFCDVPLEPRPRR